MQQKVPAPHCRALASPLAWQDYATNSVKAVRCASTLHTRDSSMPASCRVLDRAPSAPTISLAWNVCPSSRPTSAILLLCASVRQHLKFLFCWLCYQCYMPITGSQQGNRLLPAEWRPIPAPDCKSGAYAGSVKDCNEACKHSAQSFVTSHCHMYINVSCRSTNGIVRETTAHNMGAQGMPV